MDFKKEYKRLTEIVRNTRKSQGISYRNEDIAGVLGYSRTYFSGLLGKSAIVTEDHIKNIKLHFPFLSENKTAEKFEFNEEEIPVLKTPKGKETRHTNLALDTVYSLAESNRVLADNNTIIAQSQLKLVETNSELAIMLKEVFKKTTVSAVSETESTSDAKFLGLLEVIAEIGVGHKWKSKQEGLALLGNKFYPILQKKRKADNVTDARK